MVLSFLYFFACWCCSLVFGRMPPMPFFPGSHFIYYVFHACLIVQDPSSSPTLFLIFSSLSEGQWSHLPILNLKCFKLPFAFREKFRTWTHTLADGGDNVFNLCVFISNLSVPLLIFFVIFLPIVLYSLLFCFCIFRINVGIGNTPDRTIAVTCNCVVTPDWSYHHLTLEPFLLHRFSEY